jgi:chromosome segregation ATPase
MQRKQQLEAYKKSKALQAQIDETKKQRFLQMQNHHDLQRKAYESNLDRQREKIKEVEEQIKMYATKFSEFEGVWEETRTMFAAVENRCQDIAARAFAMEAQNQKMVYSFIKQVIISKEEGSFQEWRKTIDDLLLETSKWATTAEECYRLMTGQPIDKDYIMAPTLIDMGKR